MNLMSRFLPLAVVLIMSVTGCAVLDGGDPYADEPATDKDAAALAISRLNNDSMVSRATLSVTVDGGLGILYGTVPDAATRQRALQILQDTPGVYEVLDRTRMR